MGDESVKLSDKFWDCDCEANYIHPNSTNRCPRCGALRGDSPDSRADEVEAGTHFAARDRD